MVTSLSVLTLIIGLVVVVWLLKTRWPGWIALPIVILALSAIREIFLGPIIRELFQRAYSSSIVKPAGQSEITISQLVNFVSYLSLASGMIIAWRLGRRHLPNGGLKTLQVRFQFNVWYMALGVFFVGLLCNLFVINQLAQNRPIMDIAIERAVYYDEAVIFSPAFQYARLFSPMMEIGAWGLVLFGKKRRAARWAGLAGTILYIGLQILFAGRMAVLMSVIGLAIVWHYGVERMRAKHSLALIFMALFSLFLVNYYRGGNLDNQRAVQTIIDDVLLSRSLDETAFSIRSFPEQYPYLGWGAFIYGYNQAFPTLMIPGIEGTWRLIVDTVYRGANPYLGQIGEHYSFTSEHYMYWGPIGVVLFAIICGILFGMFFEWGKKHQSNPIALLISTAVFIAFIRSLLDGRMSLRIGSLGMSALVPIGIIILGSTRDQKIRVILGGSFLTCLGSYLLNRFLGIRLFDYLFTLALLLAYVAIFRSFDYTKALSQRLSKKRKSVLSGIRSPNGKAGTNAQY